MGISMGMNSSSHPSCCIVLKNVFFWIQSQILHGLKKPLEWAGISFAPAKSRSMLLWKGKVEGKFWFNIAAIPTITEKPQRA